MDTSDNLAARFDGTYEGRYAIAADLGKQDVPQRELAFEVASAARGHLGYDANRIK